MRVATNMSRGSLGFNMTPMIDVVFLLIIFFLVSSHLAQQETQLEMDLPAAKSGARPDDGDVRRVVVNVLPGGEVMIAGQIMDEKSLGELIGFENQRTLIVDAQGKKRSRLEVRIRCDRKVPYKTVEPIMVACAKAGVWKATFAVVGR